MSKLKAKLVYFSFVTRVLVPEDWSDENIVKAAKGNMLIKVENELHENLEEIIDDIECPASVEDGECYPLEDIFGQLGRIFGDGK